MLRARPSVAAEPVAQQSAAQVIADFSLPLEEKFPKLLNAGLGTEDGFIDAAELLDSSVPDEEKSVIRLRLGVAPRLDGFPYFVGYTLGHELFTIYLAAGERRK